MSDWESKEELREHLAQRLDALEEEYLSIQRLMVQYFGLHPKHMFFPRADFLREHVSTEDVLLDLGSGPGMIPSQIAAHVKTVIGVDRNPRNEQFARDNYEHQQMSVEDFLESGASGYDVAFLSHILEHLSDPVSALAKLTCDRVVVIVPRLESWEVIARKELGAQWLMDAEHHFLYTRALLREHLEQAGFTRIDVLEFDGDNGIRAVASRPTSLSQE